MSVFKTEESGSSPGGATKLSCRITVITTDSESVDIGSIPIRTSKNINRHELHRRENN